jgi:hypothetical protein
MAKEKGQKDKQHNDPSVLSFGHCVACPSVPFLFTIVLLVVLSLFFWPLCCLSLKGTEGQATQ